MFHRHGERIRSFGKAWHTACQAAGFDGKLAHDSRRPGVRNLIQAGVPQSVAMKISGHRDARVFARYNIVDTRDVAEAMRKVSQYEQEKRLARAKQMIDVQSSPQTANVHNTFTEANFEPQNPALPEKLQ